MDEAKIKALDGVMAQIEKQYGKGAIMRLGQDAGDTNMLPGDYVDMFKFEEENERVLSQGGEPATAKRILLSITKSALATDSFLSAASFQETVRVLTDAAIKGSVDNLVGLKDNIIIGKRIPAGTGLKRYRDVTPTEVTVYESDLETNADVE